MDIRFQFLRDSKGQPVGCIAIKTMEQSGLLSCRVQYQFSVLNPLDKFDRTLAREMAAARIAKKPLEAGRLLANPSMHHITETVMRNLAFTTYKGVLGTSAPSRARKAAKLWLRTHTK